MAFAKDDGAVSPVIGTILMVAVTVILAAVIAMFVFGVPANVTKTKVVAASAQKDSITGAILITYQGGQNDDSLSSLKITAPNGSTLYTSGTEGELTSSDIPGTSYKPRIGAPMTLNPSADWPPGQRHVMVVGVFSDGVSQIILDTYL
jgi:archaeal type IV pilus assembly protein PilA